MIARLGAATVVLTCVMSTVALAATTNALKTLDGEIELSWEVGPVSVLQSDQLRFRLQAKTPNNIVVEFQSIDESLGPFDVVDRFPVGPVAAADRRNEWSREYVLRPQLDGELEVPAVTVSFYTADFTLPRLPCPSRLECPRLGSHRTPYSVRFADTLRELVTVPVAIKVAPAAIEASAANGADSVTAAQSPPAIGIGHFEGANGHLWLAAAVASMVLLFGLLRLRRSGSAGTASERHPPASGQSQWQPTQALSELDALQTGEREHADVYGRLSHIIRQYMTPHLEPNPTSQTSEELLAVAAATEALIPQREPLATLLGSCDRVRFALYEPSADETDRAIERARSLFANKGG